MDERTASTLMVKLAANNGVRLTDIRAEPDYCKTANMPPETFVNRSFRIGKTEIVIGKYENQELRLISFLHELGHIRTSGSDLYEAERRAWRWAFMRAKKLGLKFSGGTLTWCSAQLETYRRPWNIIGPVPRKRRPGRKGKRAARKATRCSFPRPVEFLARPR